MEKNMKFYQLYERIKEQDGIESAKFIGGAGGVDPKAEEAAKVVQLIDALETNTQVIQQLRSLNLLSSKYKAIQEFARLLGISNDEFMSAMQQMDINSTQDI